MPLDIRKRANDNCKVLYINQKQIGCSPINTRQFQKTLLFAKNRTTLEKKKTDRTPHVANEVHDVLKTDYLHEGAQTLNRCSDAEQMSLITQPSHLPVERFTDQHGAIIAEIKAHSQVDDDINRLIKKLALSFTAKKNESHFQIGHGVFQGCQFHLFASERDLSLKVGDASLRAKRLLLDNQQKLKKRLALHEINLKDVRFTS